MKLAALICTVTAFDAWEGGPTFKISKIDNTKLKFVVSVPKDMYLTLTLAENID